MHQPMSNLAANVANPQQLHPLSEFQVKGSKIILEKYEGISSVPVKSSMKDGERIICRIDDQSTNEKCISYCVTFLDGKCGVLNSTQFHHIVDVKQHSVKYKQLAQYHK